MSSIKERTRARLYAKLDELQVEYRERAKPIVDALVALAATDPPPPIILPDGTMMKYIGPGYDDAR